MRCPCAGCVDEWTGRRVLKSEDVSEDISPSSLEVVGRYALRVHWSDGHSHGIYTFESLRNLCLCDACKSSLQELEHST